ncbi:MAG: hypothetical protein AAGF07_00730 [Patescibacteria group bacterium]
MNPNNLQDYIILRGGRLAMFREASKSIPPFAEIGRIEECLNSFTTTYPWGNFPDIPEGWNYQGVAGLSHKLWFVTKDGRRFGGAANVAPGGFYRFNLLVDQGDTSLSSLSENEGYAIVTAVDDCSYFIYRLVTRFIGQHAGVDGGNVIISPMINGEVFYQFTGRCSTCPNKYLSADNFVDYMKAGIKKEKPDLQAIDFTEFKSL